MTFGAGLAIGLTIPATEIDPEKDTAFKLIAIFVLTLLILMPILFGRVLWRNRTQLDKPDVKQKIGALYDNLNA